MNTKIYFKRKVFSKLKLQKNYFLPAVGFEPTTAGIPDLIDSGWCLCGKQILSENILFISKYNFISLKKGNQNGIKGIKMIKSYIYLFTYVINAYYSWIIVRYMIVRYTRMYSFFLIGLFIKNCFSVNEYFNYMTNWKCLFSWCAKLKQTEVCHARSLFTNKFSLYFIFSLPALCIGAVYTNCGTTVDGWYASSSSGNALSTCPVRFSVRSDKARKPEIPHSSNTKSFGSKHRCHKTELSAGHASFWNALL